MVKKLMESIREQKKNSILAMVTISGEVAFEVIIPLLMANLIDYGIDMGDMGYIVKMGIVLLSPHWVSFSAVPFPVNSQPLPPVALPATCATTCSTRCRIIHSQTSISFPPQVSSRV